MLVDHLAAHGVKAEHISDWTNTGDLTAVEALFASLDTQDADLIVAGAFGHSRSYEGLFGGVTLNPHATAILAGANVALVGLERAPGEYTAPQH
jgi:hypothetical protein